MAMRTFGAIKLNVTDWKIEQMEPHVSIKLKALFNRIPKHLSAPYRLPATPEIANDLEWFMVRYPLDISAEDKALLQSDAVSHRELQEELHIVLKPGFVPQKFEINGELRDYQARGVELYRRTGRLLIGDSVGLGKTLIGIGSFTDPKALPALVVVQAHLPMQWQEEIARFLGIKAHIIKSSKPYQLPAASIYIISYSKLCGWVDIFAQHGFLKSVVFDECQELRRAESKKYESAKAIATQCVFALGLSATPVYNYGDEVFNIFEILRQLSLRDT